MNMVVIQITGQDLMALQNLYNQVMVLRKKGDERISYNDWLEQDLGIKQITSPQGMWAQSYDLEFVSESAMMEFKSRYMGGGGL
jgi:hypothetical protein